MSENSRFAVAVHTLTLLAGAEGEPLKSEQIAASVNTNPVVIRRILCSLSNAGLVTSQKGALGGSRLARLPARITLLDVHRAVDDQGVFGLHRHSPSRRCPIGTNIGPVLEEVLEEVNAATRRALAKVTIEQVLQRVRTGAGAGKKR